MAINLQKGQGVSLRKESGYDLSRLTIGLGWDIAPSSPAYDLDAVAFLLDANGKVRNLGKAGANGRPTLEGGDVVFYNSLIHPSGKVRLSGDNQSGSSAGDDAEQIEVDLDTLPDSYQQILFVVAIYKGHEREQARRRAPRLHPRPGWQRSGNLPLRHRQRPDEPRLRHDLRHREAWRKRLALQRHRRLPRHRPFC